MEFVEAIGGVLPIDRNDERVVDALLAKRQEKLAIKPLRPRERGLRCLARSAAWNSPEFPCVRRADPDLTESLRLYAEACAHV